MCVQVCMNFECRSAGVLNYDCDVEKKCHGHGVSSEGRTCVSGVSHDPGLTGLCVSGVQQ